MQITERSELRAGTTKEAKTLATAQQRLPVTGLRWVSNGRKEKAQDIHRAVGHLTALHLDMWSAVYCQLQAGPPSSYRL
jgi:hypothetical protein